MRIVAISDTHNRHKSIKEFKNVNSLGQEQEPLGGDLIIHAGDATGRGESGEIEPFLKWYSELDFRHIILVPGNHDFGFERNPTRFRKICEDLGIILLDHKSIEIEGIKIFGSPWTPWFYDWAYNGARNISEQLQYSKQQRLIPLMNDLWKDIPNDTNILITHGPPYEILDELTYVDGTPKGQFVGCVDLAERVKEIKPDLHFFGHIHSGHGQKHLNGTSFYNVAICDEMYGPSNPVTIIDYELETQENNGTENKPQPE